MTRDVELLWFSDCPNHTAARRMLDEVIAEFAPDTPIRDVDATDPVAAERARFPGSPTIRVDGRDIDPTYSDPGDYTPRCRLYRTSAGLRGLPERRWIEDACEKALRPLSLRVTQRSSPHLRPGARSEHGRLDDHDKDDGEGDRDCRAERPKRAL